MPDSFARLQLDPTLVRARHVGYSVRMVAEIAAHYDEALDSSEFRTARCMLDAFYVHVRLLAEFLVRTTKGGDFGPADFGITWAAPEGAATARLGEVWDVASKYVVDFGGRRVPKRPEDASEFTVDGSYFRQLAGDALEVYSVFVDAVAAVTPDWTKGGGARSQTQRPTQTAGGPERAPMRSESCAVRETGLGRSWGRRSHASAAAHAPARCSERAGPGVAGHVDHRPCPDGDGLASGGVTTPSTTKSKVPPRRGRRQTSCCRPGDGSVIGSSSSVLRGGPLRRGRRVRLPATCSP